MPIYEYQCGQCRELSSFLVLKTKEAEGISCKFCGSKDLRRVLSGFAHHRSEASRLENFNTSKARGEEFYKDSRNIGLWAKKKAKELGADLGTQFDEVVEKARSGKIIDDL